MQLTASQAQVLANIEHVKPMPHSLSVHSPFKRYQLDGRECTQQIATLILQRCIVKRRNGRLQRVALAPSTADGCKAAYQR